MREFSVHLRRTSPLCTPSRGSHCSKRTPVLRRLGLRRSVPMYSRDARLRAKPTWVLGRGGGGEGWHGA